MAPRKTKGEKQLEKYQAAMGAQPPKNKPVALSKVFDAPQDHWCKCGERASFGVGVSLLRGIEGEWFCYQHWPGRPDAKAA